MRRRHRQRVDGRTDHADNHAGRLDHADNHAGGLDIVDGLDHGARGGPPTTAGSKLSIGIPPRTSGSFIEGLVIAGGRLYESSGLHGQSTFREVDVRTGAVVRRISIADKYFGEGIAVVDDRVHVSDVARAHGARLSAERLQNNSRRSATTPKAGACATTVPGW